MPIWLRKFTFDRIREYYEKEKEESEKQANLIKSRQPKTPSLPNIPKPTYNVKAPKK